jgi:hypothetical protein
LSYIGKTPTQIPLTASDITDGIISESKLGANAVTTGKITDGTIAQADISDQAINEAKMQISNAPTNGYALTAQSGNTGGLTWAEMSGGAQTLLASGTSVNQTQIAFDSSLITNTYQVYNLYFTSGARNNQDLRIYYSDDNGSTFCNVDRLYEQFQVNSGGTGGTGVHEAAVDSNSGMVITKNNVAGDIAQGLVTVYKPNVAGVSGAYAARWDKGAMHSRVITQQNPGASIHIEELRGVAIASQTSEGNTFVVNNFKIFTTGNFDIRYALYGLKLGT